MRILNLFCDHSDSALLLQGFAQLCELILRSVADSQLLFGEPRNPNPNDTGPKIHQRLYNFISMSFNYFGIGSIKPEFDLCHRLTYPHLDTIKGSGRQSSLPFLSKENWQMNSLKLWESLCGSTTIQIVSREQLKVEGRGHQKEVIFSQRNQSGGLRGVGKTLVDHKRKHRKR